MRSGKVMGEEDTEVLLNEGARKAGGEREKGGGRAKENGK